MKYRYVIQDRWPEFYGYVVDEHDVCALEIIGDKQLNQLVSDGKMRFGTDLGGLYAHLIDLGILTDQDSLQYGKMEVS